MELFLCEELCEECKGIDVMLLYLEENVEFGEKDLGDVGDINIKGIKFKEMVVVVQESIDYFFVFMIFIGGDSDKERFCNCLCFFKDFVLFDVL